MSNQKTFVIVGASLAGAKAAETLRAEGFDGRLVLAGSESERPSERPPLSKDYLRGEADRDKVYVHEADFYSEQDIELRLGRTALVLDTAAREVALDDGERLGYDRVLLATGAEARHLLAAPRHDITAGRPGWDNRLDTEMSRRTRQSIDLG